MEAAGKGAGGAALAERPADSGAEEHGSRRPPLLASRPLPAQVVVAGVIPAAFGALCGWVLGVSEVGYLILAVPVAILGGIAGGFEHRGARSGALRGLVGGALFGGFILIVHELTGKEAKADLPDPPIVLAAVTAVFGAGLGALGGSWRADAEEGRFFSVKEISPAELVGMLSALVLLGSLWLPWFGTDSSNSNSVLHGVRGGDTINAWQTFKLLDLLLVAACTAPFILTWIIARGHALTWRPGEVTMIVGMTALVLILANGIILGKPKDPTTEQAIGISLQYGYFVGILGTIGMLVSGYLRQAVYTSARKPPGVL